MLIKIYSAGQLLDEVECDKCVLEGKILSIKEKLSQGGFTMIVGLSRMTAIQFIITRELCLDIYSDNSDSFEMRSLKC